MVEERLFPSLLDRVDSSSAGRGDPPPKARGVAAQPNP
jgi:hypothetical protein